MMLSKPNKTFVSQTWPIGNMLNLSEFMNDKIYFSFCRDGKNIMIIFLAFGD